MKKANASCCSSSASSRLTMKVASMLPSKPNISHGDMLASYPLVSKIESEMLGMLLALSAGALVYVGAPHLLPRAEQENKRLSLIALAGGVLVAFIIVVSKA